MIMGGICFRRFVLDGRERRYQKLEDWKRLHEKCYHKFDEEPQVPVLTNVTERSAKRSCWEVQPSKTGFCCRLNSNNIQNFN